MKLWQHFDFSENLSGLIFEMLPGLKEQPLAMHFGWNGHRDFVILNLFVVLNLICWRKGLITGTQEAGSSRVGQCWKHLEFKMPWLDWPCGAWGWDAHWDGAQKTAQCLCWGSFVTCRTLLPESAVEWFYKAGPWCRDHLNAGPCWPLALFPKQGKNPQNLKLFNTLKYLYS